MTMTPSIANRLLWTAQVLLSALFLFAGLTKLVMSAEQLQGPIALPLAFIRFIGVVETLGAIGLVLPGLLKVRTELTGLAAAGLVIIMAGAASLTAAGMGAAAATFPLAVGVIAASVARGRWQFASPRIAWLHDRRDQPLEPIAR